MCNKYILLASLACLDRFRHTYDARVTINKINRIAGLNLKSNIVDRFRPCDLCVTDSYERSALPTAPRRSSNDTDQNDIHFLCSNLTTRFHQLLAHSRWSNAHILSEYRIKLEDWFGPLVSPVNELGQNRRFWPFLLRYQYGRLGERGQFTDLVDWNLTSCVCHMGVYYANYTAAGTRTG